MKTWPPSRKYLLILGLCIFVAPLIGFFNYLFLLHSHEFDDIDNIVKIQYHNNALYYSALRNSTRSYKVSLFKHVKPTIVAVGSSRVFQIRSYDFNVPFVNLGGTIGSFKEGERLLKELIPYHKPEIVIMGLDPWWFNHSPEIYEVENHIPTGNDFTLDMIFLPCDWLLKGKVSLPYYCQVLLGKNPHPFPTMGVFAGTLMEGFDQDGSFYPLGRAVGWRSISEHRGFANILDFIKQGKGAFKYEQKIDPEKWRDFISLVHFAQRENIRLIIFLTPVPGRIVDVMTEMADKYAYIAEVRRKLPGTIEAYYDFWDPRSFGSSDCEFLDGEHGGEITYLRIIRQIGQDPASGLGPYLNHARIANNIKQYRGKAMVPPAFYKQTYTEPDFLGLGCNKN